MVVFVDTSVILAITFGEADAADLAEQMGTYSAVAASGLLEAELRSACHREGRLLNRVVFDNIDWITPVRPLSTEITRVLDAGYVRGADCWHLATALYLAPHPGELTFLTLDQRQRAVASTLGFAT